MKEKKLTPDMLLRNLDIPYLDLILEEIFLLPGATLRKILPDCPPTPETVQDLIEQTQFGSEDVLRRLRDIKKLSCKVEIQSEDLLQISTHAETPILLDVRVRSEFNKGHLTGALCFAELVFDEFLEDVKKKNKTVITVGGSSEKNFSAAMFLKQNGVKKAYSLKAPL